jgi:hypothetical protein
MTPPNDRLKLFNALPRLTEVLWRTVVIKKRHLIHSGNHFPFSL